MTSTVALIWTSIRPVIRTFLPVGAGFALNRAKLFPTAAARGTGNFVLNIAMPCLVFCHIIPAIGIHNINSLVPLATISVIYGVAGTLMAWTIRSFFWVPHRFRYGILVNGCWGNSADMVTAVALGITASAPFDGVDDQNLAVAYISMYIFVLFVTLWAMGGFLLVAKDFEGPDVPSEEVREKMYLRRRRMVRRVALLLRRLLCLSHHPNASEGGDVEKKGDFESEEVTANGSAGKNENLDRYTMTDIKITPNPTVCLLTASSSTIELLQKPIDGHSSHTCLPTASSSTIELAQKPLDDHSSHSHHRNLLSGLGRFLTQLLKPCTVVILISFVIALIDPLKALFIPPSSSFQPRFHPVAPDGQPLLAFVFDTASFIGDACVPLGLVCLGSAFASLTLGSGGPFPKGAVVSFALGKMVLIPIFGIAVTRGFTEIGFVNRDDKVLQFVCLLLSSLPAASSQLYLTQIYSPTGTAEHLSAFLLPQYILMPFSMIGLVAYTLKYII